MQLCSGTVVSNMSRASSPSNEGMNVRENNVHNTEPVTVPASQDVENNTTQPHTTIATTSGATMWPMYGLSLRYTPSGVLPQVRINYMGEQCQTFHGITLYVKTGL